MSERTEFHREIVAFVEDSEALHVRAGAILTRLEAEKAKLEGLIARVRAEAEFHKNALALGQVIPPWIGRRYELPEGDA